MYKIETKWKTIFIRFERVLRDIQNILLLTFKAAYATFSQGVTARISQWRNTGRAIPNKDDHLSHPI
jgi:hypothetical protein